MRDEQETKSDPLALLKVPAGGADAGGGETGGSPKRI